MSTQQDIYVAVSENRPFMLNKENNVPWLSRLLRYDKSRPNGKLIYNSIMKRPYVKRMISKPGDPARTVRVPKMFHEQTNNELTKAEIKQMEADGQAIQTILLGLPEDIYAVVDKVETAQEIWLCVQQVMKGFDIGIQEKKAKLFNEWERFTSTDGEPIESSYNHFSKLMNDFKRNKHFLKEIACNLKFLNNLQPEWSRHVTIVHQTKDLHKADYTQLYDFLKYNQKEIDELRTERLVKTQDPLALMANSNNSFKVIVVPSIAHQNGNGNFVAARAEGNTNGNNGNQIRCYNCRGLGHLARNCITDKASVYDSYGSAEVQLHDNCYNDEIFNMFTQEDQYTELLEPILEPHKVPQNDINVIFEVSSGTRIVKDEIFSIINQVDARVQNFEIQFLKEATIFVRDFQSLAKEADESLAKHKELESEIKRLLRAIVSQDIMSIVQDNSIVDTSNLQTKLERIPPSSSRPKLYAVTPLPKSMAIPKVGETNVLSNQVTSNSDPSSQELKVMENNNVIAPEIFRIDPHKTSRKDNFVPNKPTKASVRTNPITVSQPHVII
nr:hypothetical protein [Tanacetum cinerariifolium]